MDCLKGILKVYFCDVGILKEFVQNVDDVGVIELYFVYDFCNYFIECFLSDNWKEL